MKFVVVMNQFKLNIQRLFLSKIFVKIKGNSCSFADYFTKFCTGLHLDIYEQMFLILGLMIDSNKCHDERYYYTLHFGTGLSDLDLDSRSQGCEKGSISLPIYSQSMNGFGWNL